METPEDARLVQIRELLGPDSWESISLALGTLRSGQQCLHRSRKLLLSDNVISKWSKMEVCKLPKAVLSCKRERWWDVSLLVGMSNDVQCSEKWVSGVNADICHGKWTKKEEKRLIVAVEEVGLENWSNVANIVRTRNQSQCQRRWAITRSMMQAEPIFKLLGNGSRVDPKVVEMLHGMRSEQSEEIEFF